MAVGEGGLQIYLQPALRQRGLSDLAPAQSGTVQGRGSCLLGTGATASPVWSYWAFLFGEGK